MNEVWLDTNVLVRLLVGDVASQKLKAEKLFADVEAGRLKARLSILVVNEIIWILDRYYGLSRSDYMPELSKLIALKQIRVMEMRKVDLLKLLADLAMRQIDFTDAYLAAVMKQDDV